MSDPLEELYQRGLAAMPAWNDSGPDVDARHAAAVAWITQAAQAGHERAMTSLADGMAGEASFDWCIRVAKAGNANPLVSALTSGDHPTERYLAVLAAADAGAPWAQTAVAAVYRLGMRDASGELVATRPLAWGWLPLAADPSAAGLARLLAAAKAGWAAASYALAASPQDFTAAEALVHARAALRPDGVLPPSLRRVARRPLAMLLDLTKSPFAERFAARQELAEAGDGEAQAWLGDRYRDGDGVAQDLVVARRWYELAAANGEVAGLRELGRCCEQGLGGPVDEARARELYQQAAELGGDAFARQRLVQKYGMDWYGGDPK